MNKVLSIVILSVLCVVLLFLCVFSFIPSFEYGGYNVYHSPLSLIQLGTDFGGTTRGTYRVKTDLLTDNELVYDNAVRNDMAYIISKRLGLSYGYYNSKISYSSDNLQIIVEIPTSTSHEKVLADSILSNILIKGLVEVVPSSTYSEDSVVVTNLFKKSTFTGASLSKIVNGGQTYFLVTASMNNEALEAAVENLAVTNNDVSGHIAIDGQVSSNYGVYWASKTSHDLSIYCSSEEAAQSLIALINYGSLQCELFETSIDEIESNGIFATVATIIFAVLLLGILVFFALKFKINAIGIVLNFLLTTVIVVIFAGLVHFTVLNIWAWLGFILGYAVLSYLTFNFFTLVNKHIGDGKTVHYAVNLAYKKSWLRGLIVNGAALVLGIILWVIPTALTASLGCALVYVAVMSLICTMGLNFAYARFFIPAIADENSEMYGTK